MNVRPPCLPAHRRDEVMNVGGQMTQAVQCRRRAMRDDALSQVPVPSGSIRRELEPGCPQRKVFVGRCAPEPIHALGDPLGRTLPNEAGKRCPRHPGRFGLTLGEQTPLLLGEISEELKG